MSDLKNINFEVSGDKVPSILIQMMVNIQATQAALRDLIIDDMIERGGDEEHINEQFDNDVRHYAKSILEGLYESHGEVDINKIIGGK